jgi:hypothetical protein
VRFLGAFPADVREIPPDAVAYVAAQLGIEDPTCLERYPDRPKTPYEHAWEIRRAYGLREYAEAQEELRTFVAARAWASTDGPKALLDRATRWLLEHKVLLPGVTTLTRLVSGVRAEAAERLFLTVAQPVPGSVRESLRESLNVEAGSRFSKLERLRTAPTRVSGSELERSVERVAEIRRFGIGPLNLAGVPPNKLVALARYGLGTKAPALRELAEPRRTAVLVATARHLEQQALDDALDLFDVLMATKLLARAERETAREQLRTLPRFAAASAKPAAAVQVLLDATASTVALSLADLWAQIELVVPRHEIAAALEAVSELAPPPDEEADEVWRAELIKGFSRDTCKTGRGPDVSCPGAVRAPRPVPHPAVRELRGRSHSPRTA